MTLRLLSYISNSLDPYINLALEEVLAKSLCPDECLLYLWRNEKSIVVGKNQNVWQECRVDQFEKDGGKVARRLSGGGALYHDRGNVNFTFAAHNNSNRSILHTARHMHILCQALRSFGLDVQPDGRNDICCDGAKFCGNAYFHTKQYSVHHGSLMVDVDTAALERYLVPDIRKLQAKGVNSLRSRVVNLASLNQHITTQALSIALLEAFSAEYGQAVTPFLPTRIDSCALAQAQERFASWEWRIGANPPFTHTFSGRYLWGSVNVTLSVKAGYVYASRLFSDALDVDFISAIQNVFVGAHYDITSLCAPLMSACTGTDAQRKMLEDIAMCLKENIGV